MYNVSDKYKQFSSAPVREHDIDLSFSRLVNGKYEEYASYHEKQGSPIISIKIVKGQTTGGFSIGGTICSTLQISASVDAPFRINDRVFIQMSFETPYAHTDQTEWLQLGTFYIDGINVNQQNMKVTAIDKMVQLAKDFNSALSYPSTVKNVLNEISLQSGTGVIPEIDIFNDAAINSKPVKSVDNDKNEIYFTRREVLGYLAGLNGGNAYINNKGSIAFSTPRETGETIDAKNVISQTSNKTTLAIDKVILNTTGTSASTNDEWTDGTVQLYVPLDVDQDVASAVQQRLSGLEYESITLKKQGTGIFEPGDLINYRDRDGSLHKMLVMGVVYELSGGFFAETLYSLAQSEPQRKYSGTQNISQNIAPSTASGSSEATALVSPDGHKLVLLGKIQMLCAPNGSYLGYVNVDNNGTIDIHCFNKNTHIMAGSSTIGINRGVTGAPQLSIENGALGIMAGGDAANDTVTFNGVETFVIPRDFRKHGVLEFRSDGLYYYGKKLAFESSGG